MPKKHYLEENGSRWYVKVGNKSDEDKLYFPLLDIAYKLSLIHISEPTRPY